MSLWTTPFQANVKIWRSFKFFVLRPKRERERMIYEEEREEEEEEKTK